MKNMNLKTISQVSKGFGISTRTLRYYEQIGLIQSVKLDNFAYRTYDEDTVLKLKQIIILRKLRIPLKQISEILKSQNVDKAIEAFEQKLVELDDDIMSLTTIKEVIQAFLERLNIKNDKLDLLEDDNLIEMVDALTVSKNNLKEEKTISELGRASEKLERLTDNDVRIVYIPPMTVASCHYVGQDPEMHTGKMIGEFVRNNNLVALKPDMRHIGFNNPINEPSSGHGYERWVSIPDDMEVSAPLKKIRFHGGLYAAHAIKMGDFDHWPLLWDWVQRSEKYDQDWGSLRCTPHSETMDWAFEEELNFVNNVQNPYLDDSYMQLDLLVPIKVKIKWQSG